MATAVAGTKL
jgi:hypothetical protein